MTETTTHFKNWCGTVDNKDAIIHHPASDDDIRQLISDAKDNGVKIRIVGSTHSSSPVICKSDENVMLISLSKYRLKPEDIIIEDHTVMVNAGWTLGKLYDHLNINKFYLESQPASSAFTIGGIVTMPIHGSRLGASLISDSMVAVTLIDMNGKNITKTELDEDFGMYKNSLGMFGIITSVTFKTQRIENFHIHVKSHPGVFRDDGHVNPLVVESKLKELIEACYDKSNPKYHHSFLDFHNNTWTTIDWVATDKKAKIYIDTPEINEIHMVNIVEEFHKHIVPNYRKNKKYLKMLGKLYTFSILASVRKNQFEDRDMFWVSTGTRVLFMSYFIPVHTEGEPLDLARVYAAMEIIMDTVTHAKSFNVDFPSDMRFVVSSDNPTSPIYKNKKTVYLTMDLTCSAANIHFLKKSSGCHFFDFLHGDDHEELNEDFRKFYARIEHKWTEMGGIPHYAKMFGFTTPKKNPFDSNKVETILTAENKKLFKTHAQPLFVNGFVQKMLN